MSVENVELVRQAFEAFNRGDVDAAMALGDPPPDYEFVPSGVLIPDLSGVQRGPEGARRLAEAFLGEFEDPRIEIHELIDAGDQVFVSATLRGRGKKSRVETGWDVWNVLTVRHGRIVHGLGFTDRDAALEAAGLSE